MKTLFQAFAKYNANVNRELIALLEPVPMSKIMNKTKAFYPSIFEVLFHMCMTDAGWLKRYRVFFTASRTLSGAALLATDLAALKTGFEQDVSRLYDFRRELDDIITRFTDEITDEELKANLKYSDYRGRSAENIMWKTLMYVFNHETHYRGELSVMLDSIDVENDFSITLTRI